nr:uncharacterized protein LOC113806132 [Penaeus vannamei]
MMSLTNVGWLTIHGSEILVNYQINKLGCEYSQRYNEQIQDMVKRGVARKMSDEEIILYKGPVFYLPHHEVLRSDSKSTPMRIVFDSSAPYMGFALNDFLAKGPDCLNNILGILLRFRQGLIGLIGDIKKMYNSVKIGHFDQNCHRFLWREMNTERSPSRYALTTVTFGDKPGGAIAMVALRKTAEMCKNYPEATKLIERDSYVDDLLASVDSHEAAKTIMNDIGRVLSKGGFQIKQWVMSGGNNCVNSCSSIIETNTEKVLGLNWDPESDLFFFVVRINFSKRIRKLRTAPDLTKDKLENELPEKLTRRMILSQVSSIYDPLGLIAPFTLKAKLLMRELVLDLGNCDKKLGWDYAVSSHMNNEWRMLFREMFESFVRCLKPHSSKGNPHLIIFADGSSKAYGAVAYMRWGLSDGSFISHLIASKCKLAPIRQMTIPRIELCSAVLACRLRAFIVQEMDFNFDSVTHLIDSEIVRSQIQKESFRFNTFVANRVSEIQEKTDPSEWYWIPSELNIADLLTRGCRPELLNQSSLWQSGPEFLALPRTDWPIKQKYLIDLPDVLYLKRGRISLAAANNDLVVDIKRYSKYDKFINVTARVLKVFLGRSLLYIGKEPDVGDLHRAEIYWVRKVQERIDKNWKIRYQRLGPKLNGEGIITVGAKVSNWLKTNWNRDDYMLLMPDHPFTKLIIKHLHKRDHSGIESTLVKLQTKFWVPGARRIIKHIKAKCLMCRRINKICESQCMGQLPNERLNPAPPFYFTSLDLFGPYLVKDA